MFQILDVRRISSQIGATGTWQGMMTPGLNAGGLHDKNNTAHTLSPQLLNEMIQYADENDIKRTRDMVIRKVITDNDNVSSCFSFNSLIFFFRRPGEVVFWFNSVAPRQTVSTQRRWKSPLTVSPRTHLKTPATTKTQKNNLFICFLFIWRKENLDMMT